MACVLGSRCDWEVVHQRVSLDVDCTHEAVHGRALLALLPHSVTLPPPPPSSVPSTPDAVAAAAADKLIIKAANNRRLSIVSTPNSGVSTPTAAAPSDAAAKQRKMKPLFPPQHNRIYLNCSPQIRIVEVLVAGKPAKFELRNPVPGWDMPSPQHFPETRFLASIPHMKRFRSLACYNAVLNKRLDWTDQGELCIHVPADVELDRPLAHALDSSKLDPEQGSARQELYTIAAPALVSIRFEISHPQTGIQFVLPDAHFPRQAPHCFTTTSGSDCASWFPCRDSWWERCTFDLDITVPSTLAVVASGKLDRQEFANETKTKKTFYFSISEPVSAKSIGFAAGEFEVVSDKDIGGISITHAYPLTKRSQHDLLHTVSCVKDIFAVYSEFFNMSYPLPSLTHVFVDLSYEQTQSFCGLSILCADMLHDDTIIDATFSTRQHMAESIARLWVQHIIHVRNLSDYWIVEGLVGYLVSLFVERAFGRNERRYQRLRSTEEVVRMSVLPGSLPLSSDKFGHSSEIVTPFFRQKSTLVMFMLADKIGESTFRDVVRQLVQEQYTNDGRPTLKTKESEAAPSSAAASPALPTLATEKAAQAPSSSRYLTTKRLLKLARHRSALNLDDFRDRWIIGNICPALKVVAEFERKKSACRVRIEQSAARQMHGILKVYIHETDEQVYEHESRIDDFRQVFTFACHSKVRKNRKRFAGGEGDAPLSPDGGGAPSPCPSAAADSVLDASDAAATTAATATEGDVAKTRKVKNDTPVLWVHVDPQFSWIRSLSVQQLPLWSQLELKNSPDVAAQIEAASCLGRALAAVQGRQERDPTVSLMAFTAMSDCLDCADFFHRVRVVVAQQLAFTCKPRRSSALDRQLACLVDFFKSRCYSEEDDTLVQPNDFSDFAEHFVIRGSIVGIGQIRDIAGFSPDQAVDLVLDLLKYNDNSQNYYSDAFYLASLLEALSHLKPRESEDRDRVWKQVERFLNFDRLFPSFRKSVTIACLDAISRIADRDAHEKIQPKDIALDPCDSKADIAPSLQFDLLQYANREYPYNVRVQAVSSTAFLCIKSPERCVRLANTIECAETCSLRYRMAEAWANVFINACSLNKSGHRKHIESYAAGEHAVNAMHAIWKLLCSDHAWMDNRYRHQLYLIYESAFGSGTPKCSGVEQAAIDREMLANKNKQILPNNRRRQRTKEQEISMKPKVKRVTKRPSSKPNGPADGAAKGKKPQKPPASSANGAPSEKDSGAPPKTDSSNMQIEEAL